MVDRNGVESACRQSPRALWSPLELRFAVDPPDVHCINKIVLEFSDISGDIIETRALGSCGLPWFPQLPDSVTHVP